MARWSADGKGGVPWGRVKLLLLELDLLVRCASLPALCCTQALVMLLRAAHMQEGIPTGLHDAYVRECMLRADQDADGLLSIQEVGCADTAQ